MKPVSISEIVRSRHWQKEQNYSVFRMQIVKEMRSDVSGWWWVEKRSGLCDLYVKFVRGKKRRGKVSLFLSGWWEVHAFQLTHASWYPHVLCFCVYVLFTHHVAGAVRFLFILPSAYHPYHRHPNQWNIISSLFHLDISLISHSPNYFLERGPLTIDGWYPRDHMPDDYPKNEKERRAAAIKYGMRPEDYKLVVLLNIAENWVGPMLRRISFLSCLCQENLYCNAKCFVFTQGRMIRTTTTNMLEIIRIMGV